MEVIPSPIIGSVLQSTTAQRNQSGIQDSDSNRRATAARELAQLEQQQLDAIEDTDNDTRVHADSGGQGSRGRSFDEKPPAPDADPPDDASEEPPRLDVTA